jgi:hypothetical protein
LAWSAFVAAETDIPVTSGTLTWTPLIIDDGGAPNFTTGIPTLAGAMKARHAGAAIVEP